MKNKIPYAEAKALAEEVVTLLTPFNERIEIAGSIRRKKFEIGDIEIVAAPIIKGLQNLHFKFVKENLTDGLFEGIFSHRLDKRGHKSCGERFQRLIYKGVPLDVFSVLPPAQWGCILAIRTGPADYSHWFVTKQKHGGPMVNHREVSDGRLLDGYKGFVPTPEETDFFREIGIPYRAPEDRQ